jgi:hypothetical protein
MRTQILVSPEETETLTGLSLSRGHLARQWQALGARLEFIGYDCLVKQESRMSWGIPSLQMRTGTSGVKKPPGLSGVGARPRLASRSLGLCQG